MVKRIVKKIGTDGGTFKKAELLEKQAWDILFISENADTRGWNPTPERRLFGYEKVVEADRLANEALDLLLPPED